MKDSTNIAILIIMASSLIVLTLEAIGRGLARARLYEKPHIRLFANGALIAAIMVLASDLYLNQETILNTRQYLRIMASLFLVINTLTAIFIGKRTLAKNQNGEIYFLLLSSLAISLANVCTDYLIVRFVASICWLLLMAALALRTTRGGKKAEVGLKLSINAIIAFILFLLALNCIGFLGHELKIASIHVQEIQDISLDFIGLVFFALGSLCLAGIPPFHFAHIDSANASNTSVSFLLLANASIQGGAHLLALKLILVNSGLATEYYLKILCTILAIALLICWLRALDQSKVSRTITYAALSVSPLFCLSLLYGTSTLLPNYLFYFAIFLFNTLTLFVLNCSLAFMSPVNSTKQTWEELSGFGRKNILQTLCFLVAFASIAGLPGTLGYFVKLSLIAPMVDSLVFNILIFLSIAIGAASAMRIFVFMFSKHSHGEVQIFANPRPPKTLVIASISLIALGFFTFVG